jgi:hypothetical protein
LKLVAACLIGCSGRAGRVVVISTFSPHLHSQENRSMRIRTLIWLPVGLAFAGLALGEDAPATPVATAVPTAVPVVSTPATPSSTPSTIIRSSSSSGTIRKLQPQSVAVALIDGITLAGELAEVDQWTMKTSFGTTNLPLSTVAGIRMAHEGNAMTTVVLHNGDALTGAVSIDQVVIQTEWGRAEIHGNHVASILFTPGLKWMSETGLNGMRWKLVTDEPPRATPAAGQPGAPRPGQPGQPGQPQRPGTVPVAQPGFQPGFRQ